MKIVLLIAVFLQCAIGSPVPANLALKAAEVPSLSNLPKREFVELSKVTVSSVGPSSAAVNGPSAQPVSQ